MRDSRIDADSGATASSCLLDARLPEREAVGAENLSVGGRKGDNRPYLLRVNVRALAGQPVSAAASIPLKAAMLFNSREFILLFLPVTLFVFLGLWRFDRPRAALNALTLASLVFYGFWNPRYVPLLVGSIALNYGVAQLIVRSKASSVWLGMGIALNLALLGYFKYANFLVDSFNWALNVHIELARITLPLAISFFTFQQISFLVDTSRRMRQRYTIDQYAAYVTFFPHEIAGPIVRHHELIPQFALDPFREGFWERVGRGISLFAIGLIKKVYLADSLGQLVDRVFHDAADARNIDWLDAWTGAVGFAWQVYFDFSAYTDMALGVALLFGYSLPINFDRPYRARSIRELWQRWHMTLSRFLRDYLFVPLATSRWLPYPRFLGMVVTMFLAGLWHGASWTYAVWGGMQGVALALYSLFDRRYSGRLPSGLGWFLTLLFWCETCVLFRADSFGTATRLWVAMHGYGVPLDSVDWKALALLTLGGAIALLGPSSQSMALSRLRPTPMVAAAVGAAILIALISFGSGNEREFIYFQF